MNYMLRALVLSAFFVSAAQASECCESRNYSLNEQAFAIRQREYFKQQLNQGRMVNSSQVMMLREGVYLLKGNPYLPDEVYEVGSTLNCENNSTQSSTGSAVICCILTCLALATLDAVMTTGA